MIKGLYIHIPFCQEKCRYCDFLSFKASSKEIQKLYIAALIKELEINAHLFTNELKTIYIGGGTPSILDEDLWCDLLGSIHKWICIEQIEEWTVESNPASLDRSKLRQWKNAGVNRLSIGAQSFNDDILNSLGRIHRSSDIVESVFLAREENFNNINLDLMYGVPNLTLAQWQRDVKAALQLEVEHLSLYGLIVEEGTPIEKDLKEGKYHLPSEDEVINCYNWHVDHLKSKKMKQYEISNYAKAGKACQHNIMYWQMSPWLGIGLGASSWLRPNYIKNNTNLSLYTAGLLKKSKMASQEIVEFNDRIEMSEYLTMGLRMNKGVKISEFKNRFKILPDEIWAKEIDMGVLNQLLQRQADVLRLTDKGRLLGNELFELFL